MTSPDLGSSVAGPNRLSQFFGSWWSRSPKLRAGLQQSKAAFIVLAPYLTIAGTIGLAIVGIDDVREQARPFFSAALWDWGAANKITVVILLAALTAVPPITSAWLIRRQSLLRETKRNVELTTAAGSNSSRVAHLITKIGDVRRGEIDSKYIGYTLVEACNYFKTRAMHTSGAGPEDRVEAYLMRAVKNGKGSLYFERLRQTHTSSSEFTYNLSAHKNSSATSVIDEVLGERGYAFATDAAALQRIRDAFKIQGTASPFCQYLIVPVRKDRKITDRRDVWGLLVLMSSAPGMIRETDEALLATYSWYISASIALDGSGNLVPAPTSE